MAELQHTINFKLRKNVVSKYKSQIKETLNDENKVLNGDIELSKLSRKRRRNTKDICRENVDHDDECSSSKIARLHSNNEPDEEFKMSVKRREEKIKPLPSREKEIEILENFLIERLEREESGSLYISGQPGTGKTACLSYVMQLPKISEGYKQVYINCTMMKSASSIYSRICKELQVKTTSSSEKACHNAIETYLNKKHKMILLVLDEIDQLDSRRQAVLYTVFEWAGARRRLVLVGVANALDLTQRALPRLQARSHLRPRTLHFAPYDKQQIIDILTATMAEHPDGHVLSPVAMQMLAAKVAAVSGDMRRALDIGRRVVELARRHCRDGAGAGAGGPCVAAMSRDAGAELRQVVAALDDVYRGAAQLDADVDDAMPLQQKLLLGALVLLLTGGGGGGAGAGKDVTMGRLHDVYKRVASSRNIAPLSLGEAADACSLLEARGALQVVRGGGGGGGRGGARAARLRLRWDEAALAAALRDKPLLSAILADVSCLTAA